FFETGKTIDAAGEDLLDEAAVEVELESGGFFGVVPGEQDTAAFGAVVEAGGHVDDHGGGGRHFIEGLGGDEDTAQRVDGKVDAGETGHVAGPGSGGVDDDAG